MGKDLRNVVFGGICLIGLIAVIVFILLATPGFH